jgi:hypothetical protein
MESLAKKFANVETQIKELNKNLKALRKDKEELSAQLMNSMLSENIESIQIDNNLIVIKFTKQYGPINKEYLQESLSHFCETSVSKESKVFAEKATEHIFTNRDITGKQVVRLLKKK